MNKRTTTVARNYSTSDRDSSSLAAEAPGGGSGYHGELTIDEPVAGVRRRHLLLHHARGAVPSSAERPWGKEGITLDDVAHHAVIAHSVIRRAGGPAVAAVASEGSIPRTASRRYYSRGSAQSSALDPLCQMQTSPGQTDRQTDRQALTDVRACLGLDAERVGLRAVQSAEGPGVRAATSELGRSDRGVLVFTERGNDH